VLQVEGAEDSCRQYEADLGDVVDADARLSDPPSKDSRSNSSPLDVPRGRRKADEVQTLPSKEGLQVRRPPKLHQEVLDDRGGVQKTTGRRDFAAHSSSFAAEDRKASNGSRGSSSGQCGEVEFQDQQNYGSTQHYL